MSASPKRRVQERTEITRDKLLNAAAQLFTEQGFDGPTIRDIENAADVQRGLLKYHFGDKESLWKAMADRTFEQMREAVANRVEVLQDLNPRERVAAVIRFYVRFCAQHPELPRLLAQEARQDTWRIRYLVDRHVSRIKSEMIEPVVQVLNLTEEQFVHWYYLLAGGSSLIFSHAPECQLLFGVDSHEDKIVDAHADMMVTMLLGRE